MKLHMQSARQGEYLIQAIRPECITVNNSDYTRSLIIAREQLIDDWPPRAAADVTIEHLQPIITLAPEVVILGTGERQQFPPPVLLQVFYQKRIGVEVMDTMAACRTYNILLGEGRVVVAGLIL